MKLAQITGINSPSNKFTNYATLPENFVSRFLLYAIAFSGLVFMVRLIFAGFTMLTSVGDPPKIQAASKNLVNSLLGLFIVIMSFFIAQVIFAILGIGVKTG